MQIKTIIKYTSYPLGWPLSKNKQTKKQKNPENNKCGVDVEELESLHTVGGIRQCSLHGKQYGNSSKFKNNSYHMIQQSQLWVYIQWN